jgi:hypothetical protein
MTELLDPITFLRVTKGLRDDETASSSGETMTPPPRFSARSLLKHVGKWAGNDLEKCLKEIYNARAEAEF